MTLKTINLQSLISVLLLIISVFVFELTHLDLTLQSLLYGYDANQWLISIDDTWLYLIFYRGIKLAIIIAAISFFIMVFIFRHSQWAVQQRRAILIFFISIILVPTSIASIKKISNMPCPKNITIYGGDTDYYKLFEKDRSRGKRFDCFPAAHASTGFSLLALVFFARNKKKQLLIGATALTLGWLMGGYKMAIGHHFLSHTIVSMLLSWLLILQIARFVLYRTQYLPWQWRPWSQKSRHL